MSADFKCATCGRDLMFEIPRNISRWNSPTDKQVFCSGGCITQSSPPDDCKIYRPDPTPLSFDHWKPHMASARLLPTTEEVQERLARVEMSAIDAQRVIMREKLFAEVEDIRARSRQGFRVDSQIADVLETLIARLT